MSQIKFSHNWNNKLNCKMFTTIRRHTPEKEIYYRRHIKATLDVILNGEKYSEARLMHVMSYPFKYVDNTVLIQDTGIFIKDDVDALFMKFGISPETNVMILIFETKDQS